MTAEEFRRLALSLPEAAEGVHMGHADFRVGGKIFATLGAPDARFATVMLSSLDQDLLLQRESKVFSPAAGAWGRSGSTKVLLEAAALPVVALALESAWKRRAPARLAHARAAPPPRRAGSALLKRALPVQQEDRREREHRRRQLQRQNPPRLRWLPRQPRNGEVRHDRELRDHEQLKDVRRGTLVRLRRGPGQREVGDHCGQCAKRHQHRE